MKARVFMLVMAMALATTSANASSIGPYYAADGSDCDIAGIVAYMPFFTYIGANLGGDAAAAGISGAEVLCTGFDPAWFNIVTPNPAANLSIGSPISGGANIAFPSCRSGPFVLLYTIQSLSLAPIPPTIMQTQKHSTPTNILFQCPLVTLCDGPVFTKLCVNTGRAALN